MDTYDVAIVGAGIAGASIGAAIGSSARVAVLEQEHEAGVHSTGRSAAMFLESYGPAGVAILTRLTGPILRNPGDLAEQAILRPRPMMLVAAPGSEEPLRQQVDTDPALDYISLDEAFTLAPMLRPERTVSAAIDLTGADIDVDALHRGYLRRLSAAGGELLIDSRLMKAERGPTAWTIDTAKGQIQAGILINASGAWADLVADRCGVGRLGFTPRRRTAAIARATADLNGPMVVDAQEQWYFKPESGGLLVSPADATDTAAGDARPEDEDVALALERINEATTLGLRSIIKSWAGLRTFSPDGDLVLGRDAEIPSFVWACGQGGYGIQSSAGVAGYIADLVLGTTPDQTRDPALTGLVSPSRFAS